MEMSACRGMVKLVTELRKHCAHTSGKRRLVGSEPRDAAPSAQPRGPLSSNLSFPLVGAPPARLGGHSTGTCKPRRQAARSSPRRFDPAFLLAPGAGENRGHVATRFPREKPRVGELPEIACSNWRSGRRERAWANREAKPPRGVVQDKLNPRSLAKGLFCTIAPCPPYSERVPTVSTSSATNQTNPLTCTLTEKIRRQNSGCNRRVWPATLDLPLRS